MSWNKLLTNIPFIIFEPNFLVLIDCGMNIIHVVIYRFIHSLHAIIDIYLALKQFCLVLTDIALNLIDQFSGFGLCNKLGRLYCINKELDLCQFKLSGTNMVICLSTNLLLDNLYTKLIRHILKVSINTFSFCGYIIFSKLVHNLRHCKRMLIICLG